MHLKDFLARVLPPSGTYYSTQITPAGQTRQFKHTDIHQLAHAIEGINNRHNNAYFATGTFGERRTKDECKKKRAFYADIDCKEGGQYKTKREAAAAIKQALKDGLPMFSILVDSGNGFHLYWTLTEDITKSQWLPYAKAVENACATHGLEVDQGISTDPARILRAPETLNQKNPKKPKPCQVVMDNNDWTFQEFADAFNQYLTSPASVTPILVDNSDLSDGLPETRQADAKLMIEQCPLFKHTAETHGEGQSEPLWHKIIHTLLFCENGHDYVHELSNGHKDYSYKETEDKWRSHQEAKNTTGAILCDTYSALSDKCADCEHRGKIKSPIALGFRVMDELPFPWRSTDKGVYRRDEDDGWELVIKYPIKDLQVATLGDDTSVMFTMGGTLVSAHLSELTMSNQSLQQILSKYALPLVTHELEELKRLMSAWVHKLRTTNQIGVQTNQFGWVKDGFHFGGTIYKQDGSTQPAFQSDRVLADIYREEGELAPWQECANHILKQDRKAVWVAIASSFAAPLLKFTGAVGVVLSIVSPQSGTGKSTAMRVAQAVWGNPRSGMMSLDDTHNSIAKRLSYLNTLPGFWDEVRERDEVTRLMNFLFKVSQGRDKGRLGADVSIRKSGEWDTLMTIATNDSLLDHLHYNLGNTDAGFARVFEVEANAITDDTMNDADARHFFDRVRTNYGVAGALYAKFLAENKDAVVEQVQRYGSKLSGELKSQPNERYWIAAVTALVVGAAIATKLKICEFDVSALQKYLITQLKNMRDTTNSEDKRVGKRRPVDILSEYIEYRSQHTLRYETFGRRGKGGAPKILMEPQRTPVYVATAKDTQTIRLHKSDLRKWYYTTYGAGVKSFFDQLDAMNVVNVKADISNGSMYGPGPRIQCIDLTPACTDIDDLLSYAGYGSDEDGIDNADLG